MDSLTGSSSTKSDETSDLSTGAVIGLFVAVVIFGGIVVLFSLNCSMCSHYWSANAENYQCAIGAVDGNAVNDLSDVDVQYYVQKNDRDLERELAIVKWSKSEAEPLMTNNGRRTVVGVQSYRTDVRKQRTRPQKH